jgi:hypothetical protein
VWLLLLDLAFWAVMALAVYGLLERRSYEHANLVVVAPAGAVIFGLLRGWIRGDELWFVYGAVHGLLACSICIAALMWVRAFVDWRALRRGPAAR